LNLAIAIDGLLEQLAATKPEWCELVEMKCFLGLTDEEAAETLGMKLRTMQRAWSDARQWLYDRIKSQSSEQDPGR
jgi:DNA-directed RNA polymerase specialized sigma24 family protein